MVLFHLYVCQSFICLFRLNSFSTNYLSSPMWEIAEVLKMVLSKLITYREVVVFKCDMVARSNFPLINIPRKMRIILKINISFIYALMFMCTNRCQFLWVESFQKERFVDSFHSLTIDRFQKWRLLNAFPYLHFLKSKVPKWEKCWFFGYELPFSKLKNGKSSIKIVLTFQNKIFIFSPPLKCSGWTFLGNYVIWLIYIHNMMAIMIWLLK